MSYGWVVTLITDLPTPESPNGKEVVVPASRASWRSWLDSNPGRTEGIWVVYRRLKSPVDGPVYMELVEEALCYGWIDSTERKVDDDRLIQWFSPRRRGAIWSPLTKERLERLEAAGLMTDRGRAVVEVAKADGSWSLYDPVEALIVPGDLDSALSDAGVRGAFESLSKSARKQHLWAVYSAKRPETREQRIRKIVDELG